MGEGSSEKLSLMAGVHYGLREGEKTPYASAFSAYSPCELTMMELLCAKCVGHSGSVCDLNDISPCVHLPKFSSVVT